MSDQNDQNMPETELPEGLVIPDSPESLVNARFYRKQAQHAMIQALHASAGRSGLSDEQKVAQVKKMHEFITEALGATTLALEMMQADESE